MSWATTKRALCAAAVIAPGTLIGAASAAHASTATPSPVVLEKQVVPGLGALTPLHETDPAALLHVAVSIAHPNDAAEEATYRAMYTPGNALFHRFLTPAQFTAKFGVPEATADRVVHDVTAKGLTVSYASPDHSYVLLQGTVAQVASTFKVHLADFAGADGSTFRANVEGPTVPAGVNAVLGLSSLSSFHTHQNTCQAGACLGAMIPQDLWSIYDLPSTDLGRGQKVGIFGEGDMDEPVADLREFEKAQTDQFGDPGTARGALPQVPVRRIPVGYDPHADGVDKTGAGEWDLDEDAITGMAPDLAELSFYFGEDLGDAAIGGAYSAWVNDPDGPLTGNSSFGGCESLNIALGSATVYDPLLRQATMEGRTMFVSTGDTGGSCIAGPLPVNGIANTGAPQAEYPSTSPYVVAVGGTVMYAKTTTSTGSTQAQPPARSQEIAWTHTGGGTSTFEPKPAWQEGITTIAGVCAATPQGNPTTTPTPCRGVPDVASLSGDLTGNGYAIWSGGSYTSSGGTSLSSPLWAGMWARILAAHPSSCTAYGSNGQLGFAAPVLYSLGKNAVRDLTDFYDISVGSNVQWTAIPRNAADPSGWDYVSGLGTPDVKQIMKDADCGSYTPTVAANPQLPLDRTVDPSAATCTNGPTEDVVGDEQAFALGLPAPSTGDPAVDITSFGLTDDGSAITFSAVVADLAHPLTPQEEIEMDFGFSYGGIDYDVIADNAAPTGPPTFTLNTVDATSSYVNIGTLTGSFDTATSTVTAKMPISIFNAQAAPAKKIVPSSALTGIHLYSEYSSAGVPADEAVSSCPYVFASSATPVAAVPEVPALPLVLLTGALTAFGGVVLRRRKRTASL